MLKTTLTSLVATAIFLAACSQEQPAESSADWVLRNGQIYTADEAQPWAEAVVVRDGKFVYVGDNTGAKAFVSDGAITTDLGGRMVIPGIVDGHTHPGLIGIEQYEPVIEAEDGDTFLAELAAWAEANPDLSNFCGT